MHKVCEGVCEVRKEVREVCKDENECVKREVCEVMHMAEVCVEGFVVVYPICICSMLRNKGNT